MNPFLFFQEDFLDLTVCVCGMSSLEEALWNMFVEEELFEGNNLYRCAQCDRLVTAAKVGVSIHLDSTITMFIILQELKVMFLTSLLFCSYSVCQTQEASSILDSVFAEIQLRLCQM